MRKIWGGREEPRQGGMSWRETACPATVGRGQGAWLVGLCHGQMQMEGWTGGHGGGPLGTYFIKAHFREWLGEEGNVPGALHGGAIH